MTLVVSAGTVVTGDQLLQPGWLAVEGERIVDTGHGEPPRQADLAVDDGVVVPGFVDMHVHGGGGHAFTAQDPAELHAVVAHHRSRGTTSMLASLVTADLPSLTASVRLLSDLVDAGEVAGIHLEGPWLNAVRAGAHDVGLLRSPDPGEVQRLLDEGGGRVRMVTLAPELPGGLDAVRRTVAAGAVAAVGHTDADHATTRAALDAGATVATHLFNGMPPLHHRDPGPVLALLEDQRATVELILDGVHLHPAMVEHVVRVAGPDRVALVTDAMAAASMPDGRYELGELEVEVIDRVARLTSNGSIAGSTVGMDEVFRRIAGQTSLLDAARMTAVTPARTLGLADAGRLAIGMLADLVVLDATLGVVRVLRRGRLL